MPEEFHIQELAPPPAGLTIDPGEVARLAHCGPEDRWEDAVNAAIGEARTLIVPRGRWVPLTHDRMGGLFKGGTPVEAIASRGTSWAFVATIGPALAGRVKERFEAAEYLRGVLLDATGSTAVEVVCDRIERACAGEGPSSRYSPGYCMWRLENQRGLLPLLRPEEIGVRLLPSMLMDPLKTVSGIVVRARAEDLIVPAEACEQCDAQSCDRRRAARVGEGT